KAEGVKLDDAELQKDEKFVKTMLKASIAHSLWGSDARFFILLETDKQFQRALSLFPEAEKIARLN
ncbi:MAG TPA: S41 family peptidase, partial [Bacteroidota bacterium]